VPKYKNAVLKFQLWNIVLGTSNSRSLGNWEQMLKNIIIINSIGHFNLLLNSTLVRYLL